MSSSSSSSSDHVTSTSSSSETSSNSSSSSQTSSHHGHGNYPTYTNYTSSDTGSTGGSDSGTTNPDQKEYTIAELKALATDQESSQRYLTRVTVVSIDNPTYGAMTVKDSTGEISVYGTRGADGQTHYSDLTDKPVKGDEILLSATIKTYKGEAEIYIGWILEVKHNEDTFDKSKYQSMTIDQAREAKAGDMVMVKGIVSKITYTQKMAANGFLLIGDSSSIYVYDNQAVGLVKEGNAITLYGTKAYFIADSEAAAAKKFGYAGGAQLVDVHITENDHKENKLDYSFAETKTVKQIVDTPFDRNITGLVYHAKALIKRVESQGFVNYYIDDFDEKTGSYVYTSNSGSDFAWLDAYDGKICDVYFTALNAKSTATGCVWRFLPVEVSEAKDFKYDLNQAAQFALDYYANEQFLKANVDPAYTGDPAQELLTEVNSKLLGFPAPVKLSYSSDSKSISFKEENGKTVFHVDQVKDETVTVKIQATLEGYKTKSSSIQIAIQAPESIQADDVKTAIAHKKDETVTVKGVVGPSLVNKEGFYLVDKTGIIAVMVNDQKEFDWIRQGQTVVLSGTRTHTQKVSNGQVTADYGEQYIADAVIKANFYGKADYPTDSFIKGADFKTVIGYPVAEDTVKNYTAQAYVFKGTIEKAESKYSTNYYFHVGEDSIRLYSGSAAQYAWLDAYGSDEVTVELALCNWNTKTDVFAGCILSVTDAKGVKTVNSLNFD